MIHALPPRPVTPERYSRVHRKTAIDTTAAAGPSSQASVSPAATVVLAPPVMAPAVSPVNAHQHEATSPSPVPIYRVPRFSSLINSISGPLPRCNSDSGSEGSPVFSPANPIADSIRWEDGLALMPQTVPRNFAPSRLQLLQEAPPPPFLLGPAANGLVIARGSNGLGGTV